MPVTGHGHPLSQAGADRGEPEPDRPLGQYLQSERRDRQDRRPPPRHRPGSRARAWRSSGGIPIRPRGSRVVAPMDRPPVLQRLLSRLPERHDRVRAQSEIGRLPSHSNPLTPGLGDAPGLHSAGAEVQPVPAVPTVAVAYCPVGAPFRRPSFSKVQPTAKRVQPTAIAKALGP